MKNLTALFLGVLLCSGCSSSGDFSWITHTWTTDHGVFALDHISRNKVDISQAVQRRYLGETYYFESEADASVFDAHPWSYLYNDNVPSSARPDRVDQN
jgi:YHS domain-containing protein